MSFLSWLFGHNRHEHASSARQKNASQLMPLSLRRFCDMASGADSVVVDTETIGSGENLQIIEIGAILLHDRKSIYDYEQLISPIADIPLSATLLSGISEADLKGQPTASQIIPKFIASISGLTIIGHNVNYDINALNQEASRIDEPQLLTAKTVDTLTIASNLFPNAPSLTLQELMNLLGIQAREDHRALSDARWTLDCWNRMTAMKAPVALSLPQRQESRRRAETERRRKAEIFMKSAYLAGRDITPINERPSGVSIETVECGVEISGDENHQKLLKRYGYDAWLWVYVAEDYIRKGKYRGYPTYWVYLDGEEIGFISKYQMERHCGQLPSGGAVMIAHIPDRAKDYEIGRLQLRLQMHFEHDPVDLSELINKDMLHEKTQKSAKPIARKKPAKRLRADIESNRTSFTNAKPHKKVLSGISHREEISSDNDLGVILEDFPDGANVWVTVRLTEDSIVVRLQGTMIGTAPKPSDPTPYGEESKVTSAVIAKTNTSVKIFVDLA